MIFIVLSSLETVHDTVQYRYCIFFIVQSSLEDKAKTSESLNFVLRAREKIHCKCTMKYTVHFIITLFSVDNVLLCVIYQLNFTIFVYVTRISRYMTLYIAFGIIRGFPQRR